jgi:hypothetical protein
VSQSNYDIIRNPFDLLPGRSSPVMSKKLTSYGPFIVGVLFGIVSGALFLKNGRVLAGLSIWSLVVLFIGYALPRRLSARLVVVTIAAVIYGGVFAYFAAASEISGKAVYYHDVLSRELEAEPVTRESSPVKFREATNSKWVASVVCLGIGTVTFLRRRTSGAGDSV